MIPPAELYQINVITCEQHCDDLIVFAPSADEAFEYSVSDNPVMAVTRVWFLRASVFKDGESELSRIAAGDGTEVEL